MRAGLTEPATIWSTPKWVRLDSGSVAMFRGK
jgi:hypothetical protein